MMTASAKKKGKRDIPMEKKGEEDSGQRTRRPLGLTKKTGRLKMNERTKKEEWRDSRGGKGEERASSSQEHDPIEGHLKNKAMHKREVNTSFHRNHSQSGKETTHETSHERH